MQLDSLMPLRLLLLPLFGLPCPAPGAETLPFVLERGDHICLVGNALAERMQHEGELESLLQARFPGHELVFRNLGFSADTLGIRQRTSGFGSPDEHLAYSAADVILAFWGFNESFGGAAKLDSFENDLEGFIQHTRQQTYNGESPPRLVLISPIAQEELKDRNLWGAAENNHRLRLYTDAMRRVAAADGVPFVDLFDASLGLYEQAERPLTLNGIHLNTEGNRAVARVIEQELLGPAGEVDPDRLAAIREAVLDKNAKWFDRYRVTDGYNVYGGRSQRRYAENISNYEVLQRELSVLDVMTANRDRRIWAVANGGDLVVDDSNTPAPIKVKTNKPGPNPDGSYPFIGGEAAIGMMTLAKNMQANLFASEEQFPELINPVQMAFDTRGRLWVAAWPTYTRPAPKSPTNDKLLIFEDTDGDGRADQRTVFADDLSNPTGFTFWDGGVLLAAAPDLVFLKDTDGDDRADLRRRILHGISSSDTHHTANSFVIGPGGALYFQEGTFHQSQIETPYGPVRNNNGCVWRFEPRTWRVDRYVPMNFANPHGHVFDRWGQDIVHDGTGAVPYHALLISGHLEFPKKHPAGPTLYNRRTRPCPGTAILSSRHFPDELQGSLLVANVIGFQGILTYRVDPDGASLQGTEIAPIVSSSDPNFRPVDLKIGPDGALYFLDWHNPLIGHLQHHIRDPNRDNRHGRIYRITCQDRPLLAPPVIDGEPVARLLDLLSSPENGVRLRARTELSEHDTDEVLTAVNVWVASMSAGQADYEHHLLEALWVHQQHDVVNVELLTRVLRSPDPRARAAATRVLRYWGERVPGALDLLRAQVVDEHPLVRCEAAVAASFFQAPEAATVAEKILERPTDRYLDFALTETMKQLDPTWVASRDKVDGKAPQEVIPPGIDRNVYLLGKEIYGRESHCTTCHQPDGKGLDTLYPPLVGSEWVTGDADRIIKAVLNGLWGPITVNGTTYAAANIPPMMPFRDLLSDEEIAAVITYVRNTWGNRAPAVDTQNVKRIRAEVADRTLFWTPAELLQQHPMKP